MTESEFKALAGLLFNATEPSAILPSAAQPQLQPHPQPRKQTQRELKQQLRDEGQGKLF
jgi:hypothetical protein